MAKHITGVVRWFDGSKGYGYIHAESGEQVFVHYSAITGQGAPLLAEGERGPSSWNRRSEALRHPTLPA